MPYLSNLDAPDDMEDQELLPEGEEKEELIVLDPEHVCSFSFNIYAIMVKWLDFSLTDPQRKQWYHCCVGTFVYCMQW